MSYSAPYGYAARPFQAGGTFPGAPAFQTPGALGSLGAMSFPVGSGPSGPTGAGIDGFAPGTQRPNRVQDWGTNGQVAYHLVVTPDRNSDKSVHRIKDIGIGMLCFGRDMRLDAYNWDVEQSGGPAPKWPRPNYGPGKLFSKKLNQKSLSKYMRLNTACRRTHRANDRGVRAHAAEPLPHGACRRREGLEGKDCLRHVPQRSAGKLSRFW